MAAQPHRNSLGADRRAGVGVHECAAAGRQHLRAAFQQARDHARLAGAEIRLAVGGEDFRDGHAGGLFDLDVGIDERNAEPGGQPAADRRLARAHHADQHHRAAAQRRAQRRPCGAVRALLAPLCVTTFRHAILVSKSGDGINRDLKRLNAVDSAVPRVRKCRPCSDSCWWLGFWEALLCRRFSALGQFVDAQPREMTVTIPPDKLFKPSR